MKKSIWVWMTVACVAISGLGCAGGDKSDSLASARGGSGGGDNAAVGKTEGGGTELAERPSGVQRGGGGGVAIADTGSTSGGELGGSGSGSGPQGSKSASGGGADPSTSRGGATAAAGEGGARAGRGGSNNREGAGGRVDAGAAQRDAAAAGTVESSGVANPGEAKGLTIYLIRHAETPANLQPIGTVTGGEGSDSFTDLGQQQVTALTEYLTTSAILPDAVLVSPAWRTQKTIEPFLAAKNLTGEVWIELDECCANASTGAEIPTTPTLLKGWKATLVSDTFVFRDPKNTSYWDPGGPYEAGLLKVMTARDLLLSQYGQSGKTLFVVGHASAGSILIGLLMGYDMKSGADQPGKDRAYLLNTGVTKLVQDVATGKFKMQGQNINKPATK